MSEAFLFMIAVVATAGVSFTALVIWLAMRAKEREDQRRSEIVRQIMESGESKPVLDYLREIERIEGSRVRARIRLTGLISIAVGVALMFVLAATVVGAPFYLAGLIPLLVGMALLIYSELMMKRTA